MNEKKVCYLFRGCPGSGKSTSVDHLCTELLYNDEDFVVCSSDDFFVWLGDGDYTGAFDCKLLPEAHAACRARCKLALSRGAAVVIIDNTNVTARECRPYVEMALAAGYEIMFVEPRTPWAFDLDELSKRNVHGVPREAIARMLGRWVPDMTVEKALGTAAEGQLTPDEAAAAAVGHFLGKHRL